VKMRFGMRLLAVFLCMILCACGGAAVPTEPVTTTTVAPTTAVPTTQITTAPTTQPEPITVYAGAVEDYLLPVEDFSWEREYAPEFVVIHFTSAVVTHPDAPYHLPHVRQTFIDYGVSIHYIIDRDGTVHCYIPEDRVAWHAGAGEYLEDPKYTNKMNLYSVGIELVAIGSQKDMAQYLTKSQYRKLDPSLPGFTQEQYTALEALVQDLCSRYEIPMDRTHVLGHEEYASRKTDPGALFDWSRLIPET